VNRYRISTSIFEGPAKNFLASIPAGAYRILTKNEFWSVFTETARSYEKGKK